MNMLSRSKIVWLIIDMQYNNEKYYLTVQYIKVIW